MTLTELISIGKSDAQRIILGGALASQRDGDDAIDLAVITRLELPAVLDGYQQTRFVRFDPDRYADPKYAIQKKMNDCHP